MTNDICKLCNGRGASQLYKQGDNLMLNVFLTLSSAARESHVLTMETLGTGYLPGVDEAVSSKIEIADQFVPTPLCGWKRIAQNVWTLEPSFESSGLNQAL
jgi:hypothetical protein